PSRSAYFLFVQRECHQVIRLDRMRASDIRTGLAAIKLRIKEHEGKIVRAQSDYDNEIIEGVDLKRIRDRERAFVADLEAERRSLAIDSELGFLLGSRDPVKAFDDAALSAQRKIVDFFMDVYLLHSPQGR